MNNQRTLLRVGAALCAAFALNAEASWTYSNKVLTEVVESGTPWVLSTGTPSSGKFAITGVKTNGTSTVLDFTEISGLNNGKVAAFGSKVFQNQATIKKVIAPHLTIIDKYTPTFGQYSFSRCYELTDVEWDPTSAISISNYAFLNCTNLTLASHYDAARGCIDLDKISSAATGAFSGCKAISGKLSLRNWSWSISSGVQLTFSGCSGVTDVELATNQVWKTASISSSTPFGFTNAEEIHPFTRGAISPYIFKSITGLKRAIFGDDALSRETEGMSLGIYSTASPSKYPDQMFCYNKANLETIWLGHNVTNLYQYSFAYCPNVNSIRWPMEKPTIGAYAFNNLGSSAVLRQYYPYPNGTWRAEITGNANYTAWKALDAEVQATYTNTYGNAELPDGYCGANVNASLKKGFVFFYDKPKPPEGLTVLIKGASADANAGASIPDGSFAWIENVGFDGTDSKWMGLSSKAAFVDNQLVMSNVTSAIAYPGAVPVGTLTTNLDVRTTVRFIPHDHLPKVDADAKAGILAFGSGTTTNYWVLAKASVTEPSAWFDTHIAADLENEVSVQMRIVTEEGVSSVAYQVGDSELSAVDVFLPCEISSVAFTGSGEVCALEGAFSVPVRPTVVPPIEIDPADGWVKTVGLDSVVAFTNAAKTYDFSVPDGVSEMSCLLVAGGGGGGSYIGGGGGGGGMISTNGVSVVAGETIAIAVGRGGSGVSVKNNPGEKGGNSSLVSASVSLVAEGGGYGASTASGAGGLAGGSGGSGGGAGGTSSTINRTATAGGKGVNGQGNDGGAYRGYPQRAGGGGGGAGRAGSVATGYLTGGLGGNGRLDFITGEPVWYAGGGTGGGKDDNAGRVYEGGLGGGGSGARSSGVRATAGVDGLGGGGGGGGYYSVSGAKGGDGVVIVRFNRAVAVQVACDTTRQTYVARTSAGEIGSTVLLGDVVTVVVTPVSGYQYAVVPYGWREGEDEGTIVRDFTARTAPTQITIPNAVPVRPVAVDVVCDTTRQTCVATTNGVEIGASVILNARITVVATPADGYQYEPIPDGWTQGAADGTITRMFKATDDPTEIVVPNATRIEYVTTHVDCDTTKQTYALFVNGVEISAGEDLSITSNRLVTVVVTPRDGYEYATAPDGWNYGTRTTALTITKTFDTCVSPLMIEIPAATESLLRPLTVYDATDYVQDGLVSMWDCSTLQDGDTTWPNTAGANAFTLTAGVTAGVDGVVFPGLVSARGSLAAASAKATFGACPNGTMEVTFQTTGGTGTRCVLQVPDAYGQQQLWINNSSGFCLMHGKNVFYYTSAPKTNGFLSVASYYDATKGLAPVFLDGLQGSLYSYQNYIDNLGSLPTLGVNSAVSGNAFCGVIYSIRLYNRWLSPREIAQNARIDRARFLTKTSHTVRSSESADFGERTGVLIGGVGYETLSFTNTSESGTSFSVPDWVTELEVLAVGGGGSGGTPQRRASYGYAAAGGDAGVVSNLTLSVRPGETYAVKVGAGGAAVFTDDEQNGSSGCDGGASSFGDHVAAGGKGGKGGSAVTTSVGGAGAGGKGGSRNVLYMGAGGAGWVSDITGETQTYGLGGAGGVAGSSVVPLPTEQVARNGGDGFGDGGSGGVGGSRCVSGKGGDGVVIVRYRLPAIPDGTPKTLLTLVGNKTVSVSARTSRYMVCSGLEIAEGETVEVTLKAAEGREFATVPEGWTRGEDSQTLTRRFDARGEKLGIVMPEATEIPQPTGKIVFNLPLFADCTITAGGESVDPVATLPVGTVVTVVAKPKAKPGRVYASLPEGWMAGDEEGTITRQYVVGEGVLADEIPEPKPVEPIAYDISKYCHDDTPLNALHSIYSDLFIHKWLDAPLDGSEPISQAEQDRISDTYIEYWLGVAATNATASVYIGALDKAGQGLFYRARWSEAEAVYSNVFAAAVNYGYEYGSGVYYQQYLSLAYSRLAEAQLGAGDYARARQTVNEFMAAGLSSGSIKGHENVHTMASHARHWLNEEGLDALKMPRTTGRAFPEAQEAEYSDVYVDAQTIELEFDGVDEDDARVRLLKQKLTSRGFNYRIGRTLASDTARSSGYPVMIALDPQASVNKSEGYTLVARAEGCDIRARDLQGVLWGIVSFIQILDPTSHRMRLCSIRDWPNCSRRGFFGRTWVNTCEFAVFNKLNCITLKPYYLSNCGFDPFRVYCAQNQAKEFKELGLDYYATVSGITMDCAWPQCWRVFRAMQTEQIMRYASLGVNVYYPYDDSRYDPSVAWMQEDQDSGLMPSDTDAKHVAAIYNDVKRAYPDFKMQFCPPFYWGPTADHPYPDDRNKYLKSLRSYLPKEVDVIWTGERVTSRTKERSDCWWFTDLIGRKPTLFQNESGIHNALSYIVDRTPWDAWYYPGFVSQDLSAAMKNSDTPSECPQITSLSDYLWNTAAYDRTESIRRGLENYVGKGFFEILDEAYPLLCHYDKYQTYGKINGKARFVKLEDIERDWIVMTNATARGRAFAGTSRFNNMGVWSREVEEWTYALLKWVRKHHADDFRAGEWTYITNSIADAKAYCSYDETKGDLFIDGFSFAEIGAAYTPAAGNGGAISTSRLIANFEPWATGVATFVLDRTPRKPCTLCMAAYGGWSKLVVKVNGIEVLNGKPATKSGDGGSRYFEVEVPAGVLKKGENTLSVYNAASTVYLELIYAVLKMPKEGVYLIFE